MNFTRSEMFLKSASGLLVLLTLFQSEIANAAELVRFRKLVLTERYYCDGIAAGDINRDGHTDVVAGPFWYEGPEFEMAHEFYPAVPLIPEESPSNSMFSFVHDFDRDGWVDILVLGRVHKHAAYWYENPGEAEGDWQKHFVFERVRGESPTLQDIDGDGQPELLCHWEGRWGWIAPDRDQPTEPWSFHPIGPDEDWPQFYHGEGIGDINGDGRQDVVLNDGWYEQPATASGDWPFHRGQFSTDRGGAQILVDDVDLDGDADVISSLHAHEWGLAWFEQVENSEEAGDEVRQIGETRFRWHTIMGSRDEESTYGVAFSQPHALALADINGDDHADIVTGKRMWAHGPSGDVEPNAPPVLYWFEWTKDDDGEIRYVPHQIDNQSGVGVQVTATDVNADERIDILTVSKLGTFLFLNEGE